MIVVLDDTLEVTEISERDKEWSKKGVLGDLAGEAKKKGYKGIVNGDLADSSSNSAQEYHTLGFMEMLSKSYSMHLPVAVAPHDFWFIASSELAGIIAKNPQQFRSVFSASESGKQTIMIPTGDPTKIDYAALACLLDDKFPNKEVSDLLIPDLSTMDTKVFNALCATMADAVQHYYDYMTFSCGIPKIKVRGTEEDYRKLAENSRRLAEILDFSPGAVAYFQRIAGLFDRMANSFTSEDPASFWRDIFSQKNVGSGGQKDINGWIREFFTDRPSRLENYNTSIAAVPYKNVETQNEYLGLTGAFAAVQDADGFWNSDFREAVFQKVAEKDAPPEVKYVSGTSTERITHYSDGTKKVEKFDESPKIEIIRTEVKSEPVKIPMTRKTVTFGFMLSELPPVFIDGTGGEFEKALVYAIGNKGRK